MTIDLEASDEGTNIAYLYVQLPNSNASLAT